MKECDILLLGPCLYKLFSTQSTPDQVKFYTYTITYLVKFLLEKSKSTSVVKNCGRVVWHSRKWHDGSRKLILLRAWTDRAKRKCSHTEKVLIFTVCWMWCAQHYDFHDRYHVLYKVSNGVCYVKVKMLLFSAYQCCFTWVTEALVRMNKFQSTIN